MTSDVVDHLRRLGPCLSGQLTDSIQDAFRLSRTAARKRVERSKLAGEIVGLDNIRFKYNEQFLYPPEDAGTLRLRQCLLKALGEAKSPLRYCLMGMRARGGLIPESLFETISGLPFQGPAKLKSERAKAMLFQWRLMNRVETIAGTCLQLSPELFADSVSPEKVLARMHAENAALAAIADWFRLQGIISAETISLRNSQTAPQFGFHAWDLVAPSYIQPLVTHTKGTPVPGFVVADVCLGHALTLEEVQYFINKCGTIRAQLTNRPFIPMLVAQWFEHDAFMAARKYGIVFTTPQNLFGKPFALALDQMTQLLEVREQEHQSKIAELLERMEQFSHLQGLIGNMKGTIFEMIVAHCITGSASGKVSYGRTFKDPNDSTGKAYDSDVLLLEPERRVVAVECKGKNEAGRVTLAEVDHWFCRVVPLIYKELKHDRWFEHAKFEFEFWTSTEFEQDALSKLQALSKTKKYTIGWKDAGKVLEEIDATKDGKLKIQYKNWFVK